MTDFRLHGQSLFLTGEVRHVDSARRKLILLAVHDGYKIRALVDDSKKASKRQYRKAEALVTERLQQNPDLRPWTGKRVLFYDSNAARGTHFTHARREEMACMMRLSLVTGVVFVIEAVEPLPEYFGVRNLHGDYEQLQYGWGDFRWTESVVGDLPDASVSVTL